MAKYSVYRTVHMVIEIDATSEADAIAKAELIDIEKFDVTGEDEMTAELDTE